MEKSLHLVTMVLVLVSALVTSGMVLQNHSTTAPLAGISVAGTTTTSTPTASTSTAAPSTSAAAASASAASTAAAAAPTTSSDSLTSSIAGEATTSEVPHPPMPPGWEDLCNVSDVTAGSRVIKCHVTEPLFEALAFFQARPLWKFDTFRNWSRGLERDHLIDLEVTCEDRAIIDLRWPYRAHNLRRLAVKNCMILNWLEDNSRPEVLLVEDRLQSLRMEGNVILVRLGALKEVLRHMEEEFECGPQQLRNYTDSGTDYSFDPTEELSEEELLSLFGNYLQQVSTSDNDCRYKELETYEVTHRPSTNIFFTHLLKQDTRLPKLRDINLSHNGYNEVPETLSVWRQEFPSLEKLNLSSNVIHSFNIKLFSYQATGHVDLTRNNLTTLGKTELNSLRVMGKVQVDVRDNPFHCDCSTADFSDFLHNHEGPKEAQLDPYYAYLWELTCNSPPERKGMRVSEFSGGELCKKNHGIFVLFVILPIAAILVGLYFRFRLEVDVFFFAHLGWLWRLGRRSEEDSREYDVYVSHGQHALDMKFVYNELRPRLETSPSSSLTDECRRYRLCLEGRDFQVGAHVAENILTKMAGSRAVVMLLSADMPADSWAEFEFQEALFRAVSERRRLLVFLQRGSLEPRRLSPALRRALRLFPLLQIGERQFWNKLEYFLKANAAFPVNVRRSGCPCRRSKLDAEKELKEVSRLAHANFRRNRQSIRMNAPTSSESPATAAEERTREATPCCEVSTHDSVTSLSSEDASRGDDEDTSVVCISESQNGSEGAATSVVRDGDSVNVSEEGDTASDKELPSYSECVDEQSPLPTSSSESDSSGSDLQKLQSDLTSAGARHSLGNDSDVTAKSRFETVAATPEICVTVV